MNLTKDQDGTGRLPAKSKEQPIDWKNPAPNDLNQVRAKEGENLEITLRDIENVPVPKMDAAKGKPSAGAFNLDDVLAREVRIILFDRDTNEFISNTYIVPASATLDGLKWKFDFSPAIEAARTFALKSDQRTSKKNIELMFELVLTIKPRGQKKENENDEDATYQLTNGWGTIPVNDLFLGG
jgi:hypothetical protein